MTGYYKFNMTDKYFKNVCIYDNLDPCFSKTLVGSGSVEKNNQTLSP